jgi:hypothetical protein
VSGNGTHTARTLLSSVETLATVDVSRLTLAPFQSWVGERD